MAARDPGHTSPRPDPSGRAGFFPLSHKAPGRVARKRRAVQCIGRYLHQKLLIIVLVVMTTLSPDSMMRRIPSPRTLVSALVIVRTMPRVFLAAWARQSLCKVRDFVLSRAPWPDLTPHPAS